VLLVAVTVREMSGIFFLCLASKSERIEGQTLCAGDSSWGASVVM
jgi:hypothetical protein